MFNKILIANRGEIAVRIIRACKEMGIGTVAVFSETDRDALHAQLADEAVCIGPNKARDSYLNMQNIISAACLTTAQAIHPGFGFLAENSVFASMCDECNIKFIGPDAAAIDLLGNKANARKLMIRAGVPVIPGSDGTVDTVEDAFAFVQKYGCPVMIKASAGGGGKGIRIVRNESELEKSYTGAKTEALAAFGDDSVYMEKMIENARHIEVQILADQFGHIVYLGERDCSLQRKNQKVLEEAPSVAVSAKVRAAMGDAAVLAAKVANYQNAGTIEFLYDKSGHFYFMEMNTRIQVEHPVTEMVTGIDIVKEQIKIAHGEPLSFSQDDVTIYGHAIECRINAECPERGFAPCPGKIDYLFLPAGGTG
ncbi:MAG: acetyl-CoA carboxylase biotin carboxylase subunit, partial [Clostridiales bacterium]|nr:acetyl-CoA carboxylase biotin carboxylase subunit [Clostridiales bacterium]